jgi:hypothetical protein
VAGQHGFKLSIADWRLAIAECGPSLAIADCRLNWRLDWRLDWRMPIEISHWRFEDGLAEHSSIQRQSAIHSIDNPLNRQSAFNHQSALGNERPHSAIANRQ